MSTNLSDKPLFSFGVITDVQFADIPDGKSFWGISRYYRHSIKALSEAVVSWNEQADLSFIVQLGDIVDGRCPKEDSYTAAQKFVSVIEEFRGGPIYHILGNHCFYNLPRDQLNQLLKLPNCEYEGGSYYSFTPYPGFRFVILDGYDISVLGWPESHPHSIAAADILRQKNPNDDKNSPLNMSKKDMRYVMFNGGVGKQQLEWLDRMLRQASEANEKVIVCCHIPLFPASTFDDTILWNHEEVCEVLHRYKCVVATFAGHQHKGAYAVDSKGIHHKVLEAVLECPPGTNAFGRIDVYQDRLRLVGEGRMTSAEMKFPK